MAHKKTGAAKPGRESPPKTRGPVRVPKKLPPQPRLIVPGWVSVDRKTRQHKNTETGEILTDRQYRKRFRNAGQSNEKIAKFRGTPNKSYKRLLIARQQVLAASGQKFNLQQIRTSPEMARITKSFNQYRKGTLTPKERRELKKSDPDAFAVYKQMFGPDSDLARQLADLGYRDEDSRAWVGDS